MSLLTPTPVARTGPPTDVQAFKIQRRQTRRLKLFEPALVRMATGRSFVMLDPRNMMRNPVMFLVEVGTVLTAHRHRRSRSSTGAATGLIVYQAALTDPAAADRPLRQLRRGPGRGARQGPGRQPAGDPRRTRPAYPARRPRDARRARSSPRPSSGPATASSSRPGRSSRPTARSSRAWPRSTSRRSPARAAPVIREAGGDHSGVTGGTRVLSDRIVVAGHRRARAELPRPDDRPGRGRDPAEDAQRDRADDRPGRVLDHLPDRHRHALPDGPLLRPHARHPDA